jgi:BirA family biotin operon repressor/biotin-[acetyl-CoA-carboxylase] ligase
MTKAEILDSLQTQFIGREIEIHDRVGSTNDIALQRGAQGTDEGALILAEEQNAGRGRHGRKWHAPRDSSILASLILRHRLLQSQVGLPNLIGAIAVAEAIRYVVNLPAQVKWPNDVVLNDKKVCGVLTELGYDNRQQPFFVTGFGVNVNIPLTAFPEELRTTATSLQIECGNSVSRVALLQAMLKQFEAFYLRLKRNETARIIEATHALSATIGRWVSVETVEGIFDGEAEHINDDGGLVLRGRNGVWRKYMTGEVVKIRQIKAPQRHKDTEKNG